MYLSVLHFPSLFPCLINWSSWFFCSQPCILNIPISSSQHFYFCPYLWEPSHFIHVMKSTFQRLLYFWLSLGHYLCFNNNNNNKSWRDITTYNLQIMLSVKSDSKEVRVKKSLVSPIQFCSLCLSCDLTSHSNNRWGVVFFAASI